MYLAVAAHYPVVPLDPPLPQVMTRAELQTVRSNLTIAALEGQYARGDPMDLAPVVTAVNRATATISDCVFDHAIISTAGHTSRSLPLTDVERLVNSGETPGHRILAAWDQGVSWDVRPVAVLVGLSLGASPDDSASPR